MKKYLSPQSSRKIAAFLAWATPPLIAFIGIVVQAPWLVAFSILWLMAAVLSWFKATEYYHFFLGAVPFICIAVYIETQPYNSLLLSWLMFSMMFASGLFGYGFGVYHSSLDTGLRNRTKQAILPVILVGVCAAISHWIFPHPFFTLNVLVVAAVCYAVVLHNLLTKPAEFTWAERNHTS